MVRPGGARSGNAQVADAAAGISFFAPVAFRDLGRIIEYTPTRR